MVVLVVSLFCAGALVLLLLAASVRAAAAGRAQPEPLAGPPLVAGRGARFGDATALERAAQRPAAGRGLRVATPVAQPRPVPFREPRAA